MNLVYDVKTKVALFLAVSVCLFTLAFAVGVTNVHAQEANETDTASLQEQIDDLLELIASLRAQVADLNEEVAALTRTLAVGSSGDDVEDLQEFLANDPTLYPEGIISGYFGTLTEAAVRRFQERFGLEQVGVVGPMTRGTLNKLFNKERGQGNEKENVLKRVTFEQNEDDEEDVDLSEFTPGVTGVLVCHKAGNSGKEHTIAVGGPAVQAHIGHGDELGSCDGDEEEDEDEDEDEEEEDEESDEEQAADAIEDAETAIEEAEDAINEAEEDNEDTDDAEELLDDAKEALADAEAAFEDEEFEEAEELADEAAELAEDAINELPESDDETAPVIDDIDVSDISTTSATITWETDEDANSTVWYSTDEGFEIDDAGVEEVNDSDMVTEHSIELDDLEDDTVYYFIVGSEDEDGNESESDEETFTTES